MNDRAIIDTSAWIMFFRKGKNNKQVADEVERLIIEELAYYTEPVYIELVVGAGARSRIRELEKNFGALPIFKAGEKEWLQAWKIAFSLRTKGLRVDIVDLIVAAAAINKDVAVFHHDKHFRMISGIAPLKEYSFLPNKK